MKVIKFIFLFGLLLGLVACSSDDDDDFMTPRREKTLKPQTLTPAKYPYGFNPMLEVGGGKLALLNSPSEGEGVTKYRSSNSKICTVNSNTGEITPVAVGDCIVQAQFAGNDEYGASRWVQIASINVGKSSSFSFTGSPVYLSNTMHSEWLHAPCPVSYYSKPKVDFLILWDNSDDANYTAGGAVNALLSFANLLADKFDLRLALAPLFSKTNESVEWKFKFVANTPLDSNSSLTAADVMIPIEKIPETLASFDLGSNTSNHPTGERGILRAKNLLGYGIDNKIFRPESYLNVVMLSSGDDMGSDTVIAKNVHKLLCSRGHYSGAIVDSGNNDKVVRPKNSCSLTYAQADPASFPQMLRFHSVSYPGHRADKYQKASRWIYYQAYQDVHGVDFDGAPERFAPSDQNKRNTPDYYNVSGRGSNGMSLLKALDNIYYSVYKNITLHPYRHWPIDSHHPPSLWPEQIERVYLEEGNDQREIPVSNLDGYVFQAFGTGVFGLNEEYIRESPNYNQKFKGEMLKFTGQTKIHYPQCVRVELVTGKAECFNAIALPSLPKDDTLTLKINGTVLNETNAGNRRNWKLLENGRSEVEFKTSYNILANCSDGSTSSNEINRTGYILRLLNGNKYKNTDTLEVHYDVDYPDIN